MKPACYARFVKSVTEKRAEVTTIKAQQFQAECLSNINEIEQGDGDIIVMQNGEPTAQSTGDVRLLPAPFFGCDADMIEIFVNDLSTVSAFAAEEWGVFRSL